MQDCTHRQLNGRRHRPGSSLAVGGFGLTKIPDLLIAALAEQEADGLEVFSNKYGVDGTGLGVLLDLGRIRRVTASYVWENMEFARQYLCGKPEVELTPQSTLAERLRAGGCGIPPSTHPRRRGHTGGPGLPALEIRPSWGCPGRSPPREVPEFRGNPYIVHSTAPTASSLTWTCSSSRAQLPSFSQRANNRS